MELISKIVIALAVVGILRASNRFKSMSRELDESAMTALNKIMQLAEESGYPSESVPLLMLLTVMAFMLAMGITLGAGR